MLDQDIISPYIGRNGDKHIFFDKSVEIAQNLMVHSRGLVPTHLFQKFRPNEDDKYLEYRQVVYKPVTKTYYSKVVNTIKKINRAEDWNIQFDKDSEFKKYMVDQYPYFESFENWFFSIALNQMCEDPNSVFAVIPQPKDNPEDDTEQYKPFTYIFPSENVIYFKENRLCILLSEEKSEVEVNGKKEYSGNIYYCIDRDSFMEVVQVGKKESETYQYDKAILHTCKKMPALKSGGIIEEFSNGDCLYDSFIGDALPFWDLAVNNHSDHQVNMAIHLHPREWELFDTPCKAKGCKDGKIEHLEDGKMHKETCGNCKGTGMQTTKSPFDVKYIKPTVRSGADDVAQMPTPPMGIVERDIASISFLKQEFKDNIGYGLSALNMEFLMNEPQLNSGVAKSLDRQEFNSYVYTIARHVVNNVFNPLFRYHACWMYPNQNDVTSLIPAINVPSKFDILSSDLVSARLEKAKLSGLSPSTLSALEFEYVESVFGEGSIESNKIKIANLLDPLPNKSEDEKMTILSNQGVTKENYILSSNITSFINRAISENINFINLEYAKQVAILDKFVQEVVARQKESIIPITIDQNAA